MSELAVALDQALDMVLMQMITGRFCICESEGRDYLDSADLQEIDESLREDLRSWRSLAGGTLRSRIVAACGLLDIKVAS